MLSGRLPNTKIATSLQGCGAMKLIFKAEWHAHVTAGIAVLFSVCVQQVFKLIRFVVSPCATMMLFTADAQRKRPKGRAVFNCKTKSPVRGRRCCFLPFPISMASTKCHRIYALSGIHSKYTHATSFLFGSSRKCTRLTWQ